MNQTNDNQLCVITCNPDCIFKKSVIKIERELKFMLWFYIIMCPLAFWKIIELVILLIK